MIATVLIKLCKNSSLIFLILISSLFFNCTENTSNSWEPKILKDFKKDKLASILPDFSYAGYKYSEVEIPTIKTKPYNIINFGAIPNDGIDDTNAINRTIETAGKQGGGIVFFPKGVFHVNMDTTKTNIVKINYSNILMRGSGSGKNGTVIFSGSATNQAENNSPWLSPFVFQSGLNLQGTSAFFKVEDLQVCAKVLKEIKKGETIIEVSETKEIKKGDVIVLALKNTTDQGDLINDLMQPLEFEPFQTSYLEAGKQRAASFQYTAEIDLVLDAHHIKLKQPLRRTITLKFKPTISIMPMLKNVGIEHFKFESAWDGNYTHHANREMDYGWGAINLQRVSHGWIRDIHIDNYTQTTHLINSRNVTIENIKITGNKGHYSPKMYHSSDNLVQNIYINSHVTHGPGLEGCSFGNVFRNLFYKYPTPIDLHGISNPGFCPPMYNLFENINGVSKIAGGGAPQNLPHSGEYNTLWNIEMTGWEDGEFQEVFYSWIWRNPEKFNNVMHIDCHKQYLRTNVIGVRSINPEKKLSIAHSFKDRANE